MAENLNLIEKLALQNNLGTITSGVVLSFSTSDIEELVRAWLSNKGLDESRYSVRCISKQLCKNSDYLRYLAKDTSLPFIIVLFKKLNKGEIGKSSRMAENVRRNIMKHLNNYSDRVQFSITTDDQDNAILKDFVKLNKKEQIAWQFDKKSRKLFVSMIPEAVWYLAFNIDQDASKKLDFDFLNRERIVNARGEDNRKEALYKVVITYRQQKPQVMKDDIFGL